MKKLLLIIFFILVNFKSYADIDNKDSLFEEDVKKVNQQLQKCRKELITKYDTVTLLHKDQADEKQIIKLQEEIKQLKDQIHVAENQYRQKAINASMEEHYAFWDQGDTTLSKLIMEYGSSDYLYIIPSELGSIKINMYSSLPIPQDSWSDMIELILLNNGIGVKKLTPYLRQLYLFKHDLISGETIASRLEDIEFLPDQRLVFFIFSPKVEQLKATQSFFEKFSHPKQASIQIIGNKIIIVSTKKNVEKLLLLHKEIWDKKNDKIIKVINLEKTKATEIEKIINSFFYDQTGKSHSLFSRANVDKILIYPLLDNDSLVLVGDKSTVERTEKLIYDLELQIEEPDELIFFVYRCKHTDPQDIAQILSNSFFSLTNTEGSVEKKEDSSKKEKEEKPCEKNCSTRNELYKPPLPVNPGFVRPKKISEKGVDFSNNFVVDAKTGSVLITIPKKDVAKTKKLLKTIDVPKSMTQIDVLLVEKKLLDRKQTGINILKIGAPVEKNQSFVSFDASAKARRKGILDFIFSKKRSDIPSIDLTMSFLMAQEDLKINANPSVLAINQTPATISIVEEMSINNGAIQVDCNSGWRVEKSYTRAQFGIIIEMVPTIHLSDPESLDDKGFITLQTDITFDSTQESDDDRPPVVRRHIQNEVRIADGETVIIGGLRKKTQQDNREKIPFLGDIPGVGKLFGTTKLSDSTTEMFIFLTPRIIKDPIEGLRKERQNFLKKRPGDIPEFLKKIEESKKKERKKMFSNSMKVLFD